MKNKYNNEAINAIKRTLTNVLMVKAERIAEAAYQKDLAKVAKADKAITAEIIKLSAKVEKYDAYLAKESKLSTAYFISSLAANLKNPDNKPNRARPISQNDMAKYRGVNNYYNSTYSTLMNKYQYYLPTLQKEEALIEQFVLNLLIGETTVSEMNNLIDKLNTM